MKHLDAARHAIQSIEEDAVRSTLEMAAGESKSDDLFGMMLGEVEDLMSTDPTHAHRRCHLEQLSYDLYQADPLPRVFVGQTNLRIQRARSREAYEWT